MSLVFYYTPRSAPCRAVQMLAKALGLALTLNDVDLVSGAQMSPEYLKVSLEKRLAHGIYFPLLLTFFTLITQMNPQHCVPTLVDDGLVLWESRAILSYMANKYEMQDSLYPKDPEKRAKVDQMLYFDMDLYSRFKAYYMVQIFEKKPADPAMLKRCEEAFGFLDSFLDGHKYAAGEELTIADFPLVVTVSNFKIAGFPVDDYPNVKTWYKTCKATMPGWEINEAGGQIFEEFISSITQKELTDY